MGFRLGSRASGLPPVLGRLDWVISDSRDGHQHIHWDSKRPKVGTVTIRRFLG